MMKPDRDIEWNKYAQRRLDEHLRPIDNLLVEWAKTDARHDGAPRLPAITLLGRVIVQGPTGASQSGAPPSIAVDPRIEIIGWCVAQLRSIHRQVIEIEYVLMPGASHQRKRKRLRMSEAAWNQRLKTAREIICALYAISS